jgi:hypothetical protein
MAVVEMLLCFILFPLVVAAVFKGGTAGKIAWYLGTAIVLLIGDSLASATGGDFAGLMAITLLGVIAIPMAYSLGGRSCPFCRSKIHPKAVRCPKCQAAIPLPAQGR